MKILPVAYGSPLYRECLVVREKVLRIPLGQRLTKADLATDPECRLFAALCENRVVGAGVLEPHGTEEYYLKQLAVDSARQQQGTGRLLMASMENFARQQGGRRLCLHSRVSAQGFYEKLGYQTQGEAFLEFTIPHIEMFKDL